MNVRATGPVALMVVCAWLAACGGVDQKKFDAVYTAAKALQSEVQSSGNTPRPEARDRLKELDAEINALQDHTIGIQEANALHASAEAAEAYRHVTSCRARDRE